MCLRDNTLNRLRRLRVEYYEKYTYCKYRRRKQQKTLSFHFVRTLSHTAFDTKHIIRC